MLYFVFTDKWRQFHNFLGYIFTILLYSRLDIYGESVDDAAMMGLTAMEGMCTRYSTSISEDRDYVATAFTLVHELAHR